MPASIDFDLFLHHGLHHYYHYYFLPLVTLSALVQIVSASAIYNNEFFPRISKQDIVDHWNGVVDAHNFIKDTFSCEVVQR